MRLKEAVEVMRSTSEEFGAKVDELCKMESTKMQ